jgi:hypothetical protein
VTVVQEKPIRLANNFKCDLQTSAKATWLIALSDTVAKLQGTYLNQLSFNVELTSAYEDSGVIETFQTAHDVVVDPIFPLYDFETKVGVWHASQTCWKCHGIKFLFLFLFLFLFFLWPFSEPKFLIGFSPCVDL